MLVASKRRARELQGSRCATNDRLEAYPTLRSVASSEATKPPWSIEGITFAKPHLPASFRA